MVNTVREFIIEMLDHAAVSYEVNVSRFSRWKHKKNPTHVHLAKNLFDRLMTEEGLDPGEQEIIISGAYITNQPHPKEKMSFVIDVHRNYPAGYDPSIYGLKSNMGNFVEIGTTGYYLPNDVVKTLNEESFRFHQVHTGRAVDTTTELLRQQFDGARKVTDLYNSQGKRIAPLDEHVLIYVK